MNDIIRHNLLKGKQPPGTNIMLAGDGQDLYEVWHRPAKGNSAERWYSLNGVRCDTSVAAATKTKDEGHRPSRA